MFLSVLEQLIIHGGGFFWYILLTSKEIVSCFPEMISMRLKIKSIWERMTRDAVDVKVYMYKKDKESSQLEE